MFLLSTCLSLSIFLPHFLLLSFLPASLSLLLLSPLCLSLPVFLASFLLLSAYFLSSFLPFSVPLSTSFSLSQSLSASVLRSPPASFPLIASVLFPSSASHSFVWKDFSVFKMGTQIFFRRSLIEVSSFVIRKS